jgi:hypothetical protein
MSLLKMFDSKIFCKLGTDKAMEHLKFNLNLKGLLSSAVHRACSRKAEYGCACCLPRWAKAALLKCF